MKKVYYSLRHTVSREELHEDDFDGFTLEFEDEDFGLLIEQVKTIDDSWQSRFEDSLDYLAVYAREDYPDDADEHRFAHIAGAIVCHCANEGLVGDRIEGDVILIIDELDVGGQIMVSAMDGME